MNIDIPEKLSQKLTIIKGQLGMGNKQEVLLYIIDKFTLEEKDDKTV